MRRPYTACNNTSMNPNTLQDFTILRFLRFKISRFQDFNISRFQHFNMSRLKSLNISTFQGWHVSTFQHFKVEIFLKSFNISRFRDCNTFFMISTLTNRGSVCSIGNVEMLKCWTNTEMLKSWNVEMLKCWNLEIVKSWRYVSSFPC